MKTKAAVAFGAGKPLEVVEVDLDGPRAGEVLVEIKATGVCHTDAFTLSGDDPEGAFPAILGHEGAGIVVEVGPGVKSLKPGDHVIPLYTAECRECEYCLNPKTNLCQAVRSTQGQGVMPDGTSRFSFEGKPILHYMGCSTFSNYSVLPEISLAKVRKDAPFDKICYIGCGVTTGIGAVAFTMKVEAGSTVAVFGLGGIGLNVIQGAKMVGATRIIGIDLNPAREGLGKQFGMTDFINPKDVDNVVDHIIQMTGGGVDYSFECIGNVDVMRQALEHAMQGCEELYLSIDIDAMDTGYLPGTGSIVHSGITPRQYYDLLDGLAEAPLGGLDIVEVSPPLDPSERTEFLAAEMLFRILRRFRTRPVTEQ